MGIIYKKVDADWTFACINIVPNLSNIESSTHDLLTKL